MRHVIVVGAGAVGSAFIQELSKFCLSNHIHTTAHLYDFDDIEERNCAAQCFDAREIGGLKAVVCSEKFSNEYLTITPYKEYVDAKVIESWKTLDWYDNDIVIVDGVDNLKTRKLLWMEGFMCDFKVMHLALSAEGFGLVNWNFGTDNTYCYDFSIIGEDEIEKRDEAAKNAEKLPPCELNKHRHMMFSVGLSGTHSLMNYWGIPDECLITKLLEEHGVRFIPKLLFSFRTTMDRIELLLGEGQVINTEPTEPNGEEAAKEK